MFLNPLLAVVQSVAEVKAGLAAMNDNIWLPLVPMMGNFALPAHYAIFDKTGAALVIEFDNNKMNVYDNPVGVLTNYPEFPWQLKNLRNYTFSNVDRNSSKYGECVQRT